MLETTKYFPFMSLIKLQYSKICPFLAVGIYRPSQIACKFTTVHTNGVTRAQKFVHDIEWQHNRQLLIACTHRPLCFKKIRTTITIAFLIFNTVVPNPYNHSTAFDPQSFVPLHPYLNRVRFSDPWVVFHDSGRSFH